MVSKQELRRWRREQAVIRAAIRWWKDHRPVEWDQAQHLVDPAVNVITGGTLALAVAKLVAAKEKVRR